MECQWCNLVEDIHNFQLATLVSMAGYLLSGPLIDEVLWPAQYKTIFCIEPQLLILLPWLPVLPLAVEPCPGPAMLLAATCTLCWHVCVYEYAHLHLCWQAIVLNYQVPFVIGQTSMEGVHYITRVGTTLPYCQSECSEVLTLQI